MINETDYCGNVSGSHFDKVKDCGFRIFYGNIKNAPLIEQCSINMECEVKQVIEIDDHNLVTGKIIESYKNNDCFTNDIPDVKKIDPLCFCTFTQDSMGYYKIGQLVVKSGHTYIKPKIDENN